MSLNQRILTIFLPPAEAGGNSSGGNSMSTANKNWFSNTQDLSDSQDLIDSLTSSQTITHSNSCYSGCYARIESEVFITDEDAES